MTVLLTSFTTWLPHQKSNASDDLLAIIKQEDRYNCCYLKQLPVNIGIASKKAIAAIEKNQPSAIICCGMAESRDRLTIESNARCEQDCLSTKVNLSQLIACLSNTSISNDAGQFVCEGLYYQILHYLQLANLAIPCIFVHVPLLTPERTKVVLQDFQSILDFFLPAS